MYFAWWSNIQPRSFNLFRMPLCLCFSFITLQRLYLCVFMPLVPQTQKSRSPLLRNQNQGRFPVITIITLIYHCKWAHGAVQYQTYRDSTEKVFVQKYREKIINAKDKHIVLCIHRINKGKQKRSTDKDTMVRSDGILTPHPPPPISSKINSDVC